MVLTWDDKGVVGLKWETHNDLHIRVACPHQLHHLGVGGHDVGS